MRLPPRSTEPPVRPLTGWPRPRRPSPPSTPPSARRDTTSSTITPSTRPRSASRQRLRAPVVHTLHLPPDAAVADALRDAARRDRAPTVAGVSAFQASAWRHVVPVDAILPPFVPTRSIRWSPIGGGWRGLRRQAESGEGSGRGDRDRASGRRPDRCLRRQLRRRLHPGTDRPATRRSGRRCPSRRSANRSLGGDGARGRRSVPRQVGGAVRDGRRRGAGVRDSRRGASGAAHSTK